MSETAIRDRPVLAGAGILGFCGVAAAAAGAHATGDPRLMGAVALVCLAHATALLALSLSGRRDPAFRLCALLLFSGAAVFSVDIALRALGHGRLFSMAAPSGGIAMMAGWLVLTIAAIIPRRS